MTFVWTREANDLLTQIYLNQPVVTDHDLNQVIHKIKESLAVVLNEKDTETSLESQLLDIPHEEILLRLASLPDCPQPGFTKIDWTRKFGDTCLYDYLVQFWEKETRCRITEDLDIKFVPDWSKFYKSVLLLNSIGNFSENGEDGEDDVIPWAHTCQERIEGVRRGYTENLLSRKRPVHTRSTSLCVSQPCTNRSQIERASLSKKNSKKKIAPPKNSVIRTRKSTSTNKTPQDFLFPVCGTDHREQIHPDRITGNKKRSPIVGSTLWDDYLGIKDDTEVLVLRSPGQSPKKQNSQNHLETEQGKIRSHSPVQEKLRSQSTGQTRRSNSQKQLEFHGSQNPVKTHSRQSSQGKIRTHGTHSPLQTSSRRNSQKMETEQLGSSTQSSPIESPEQRKARSQGTSPVCIRQISKTEGLEERKRGLRTCKKQSRWGLILKESEIIKREKSLKREMSSQSPSPTQEFGWGVEEDSSFLDYDNALSHTSSEI